MNGAIIGVFLVIVAYLVMMLAIGFFYSKGNNDSSDFYLGGRKLGPFVTAMSAEASDMSSWLLMGLPGVAYLSGICDASWTAIGLAIGTYLNWLIVAKRIRRYSAKTNSITLPDFFANRYRDDSKLLLGISSIFYYYLFCPVYSVRIRGMWKTVLHIIRNSVYGGYADQCCRYCRLHSTRWIYGSELYGSDPEYCYDDRACPCGMFRRIHERRSSECS